MSRSAGRFTTRLCRQSHLLGQRHSKAYSTVHRCSTAKNLQGSISEQLLALYLMQGKAYRISTFDRDPMRPPWQARHHAGDQAGNWPVTSGVGPCLLYLHEKQTPKVVTEHYYQTVLRIIRMVRRLGLARLHWAVHQAPCRRRSELCAVEHKARQNANV